MRTVKTTGVNRMKNLNMSEVAMVSGGCDDNGGYNVSFIVQNTATWALMGLFLGGSSTAVAGLAMMGAGYATAMMLAKCSDSYFFPASEAPKASV